jgi:hypothetical protein
MTPYLVAATVALMANTSAAQVTKTLTGDTTTVTATVEAIDTTRREVTLLDSKGTHEVLTVPRSVKRFDSLKVGDKVKAHYYENIVLRLKAPGEKAVDTAAVAATPAPGEKPTGTLAGQRTITATITALDPAVPSVTFEGPNGWKYSSRVQDKKALAQVKVGDRVDITWTQAALLSFDEP